MPENNENAGMFEFCRIDTKGGALVVYLSDEVKEEHSAVHAHCAVSMMTGAVQKFSGALAAGVIDSEGKTGE